MRTDKERISEMHKRAMQLESEKRTRNIRMIGAACSVASFVLLIVLAASMPALSEIIAPADAGGNMRASIFSGSPALGYIVIAILAFLLGAAVTVFCYQLKKQQDKAHALDEENNCEDDNRNSCENDSKNGAEEKL